MKFHFKKYVHVSKKQHDRELLFLSTEHLNGCVVRYMLSISSTNKLGCLLK